MNRDSLASVASLPQLSVKRGDDSAFQRISYKRDDETLKNVVFPKLIPGSQAGFSSMDSAWMVGFVEQDVHQLSTTEPQNEYQVKAAFFLRHCKVPYDVANSPPSETNHWCERQGAA